MWWHISFHVDLSTVSSETNIMNDLVFHTFFFLVLPSVHSSLNLNRAHIYFLVNFQFCFNFLNRSRLLVANAMPTETQNNDDRWTEIYYLCMCFTFPQFPNHLKFCRFFVSVFFLVLAAIDVRLLTKWLMFLQLPILKCW